MRVDWLGAVPAAAFLAQDLRRLGEGGPSAAAAVVTDTTISVGVAMRVPEELERSAAALEIPILRRSTGGTGLLHRPGDLLWSVVLPRDDPRVGRDYVRAYGRLGGPIAGALRAAGVPAGWTASPGLSDRFCLFGPRGEVLAAGPRVLGGAAQHLRRGALLHHGVVGHWVDRPLLGRLFGVDERSLSERLGSTEEAGLAGPLEGVGRAMLARWAEDDRSPG